VHYLNPSVRAYSNIRYEQGRVKKIRVSVFPYSSFNHNRASPEEVFFEVVLIKHLSKLGFDLKD
jgi:predicted fused transcriptional regulator/phosphomethylpyrimidine kinase